MSQALKEIGEVLETTRKQKGLKVEDLAQMLKIRQRYLLAIERGELDELPVSAYIIGYLRSYANALGLDGDTVVARFKEEEEVTDKHEAALPEPHKIEMRPLPLVLMISIVAAIGLYVYWYRGNNEIHSKITTAVKHFKQDKAGGDIEGPFLPASLDDVHQEEETARVTLVSDISHAGGKDATIVLLAKGTTWIQVITKNNDFLLEKKLRPGESYHVPARKDLLIRSGNPASVEVYAYGTTKKALLGTLANFDRQLSGLTPASDGKPVEE